MSNDKYCVIVTSYTWNGEILDSYCALRDATYEQAEEREAKLRKAFGPTTYIKIEKQF